MSSDRRTVLIYLDGEALHDSIDLLAVADRLYGAGRYRSRGLFVGDHPGESIRGTDSVFHVSADRVAPFDVANIAICIDELQREHRFDAILIPASAVGRMLAPRVAMRIHTGLVADVTEIRRNGEESETVEIVRPAFSGRMLAGIVNRGEGSLMMTVRANTFSRDVREPGGANNADGAADGNRGAEIIPFVPKRVGESGVRLLEMRPKTESADIRESDVLVSGGGGVLRHFNALEDLAEELGGMVAASRKVVDSGVAPRRIQVGQSGKTVSPRLYIAIGISGSIQHVVGLKNAEYVIAVNSNRHAPICSLADIVVEGDAREFIERMIQRLHGGNE